MSDERVYVKKEHLRKVIKAMINLEHDVDTDPQKLIKAVHEMADNLDPLSIDEAITSGHGVVAAVNSTFEDIMRSQGRELVSKADVLTALRQAFEETIKVQESS